ncbi:uncharacterized protein LOC128958566 [Oppia nitens]|uniref:uncharacterized protein LOC128958566 n=1 Tax=Oppia nitens TaxID=1686743 RepID=UPI0023DB6D3B|nr:uncharacterized protein LOC128958566 [Oppia nitens]
MITLGYIAMSLLVVCTILGSGQSSILKPQSTFDNLPIGQNIVFTVDNKLGINFNISCSCIGDRPGYECCKKFKDDGNKCINSKLEKPSDEETKKWTDDQLDQYFCCGTTIMFDCVNDISKTKCSSEDHKLYIDKIDKSTKQFNQNECVNHKIVSGQIDYCRKM